MDCTVDVANEGSADTITRDAARGHYCIHTPAPNVTTTGSKEGCINFVDAHPRGVAPATLLSVLLDKWEESPPGSPEHAARVLVGAALGQLTRPEVEITRLPPSPN